MAILSIIIQVIVFVAAFVIQFYFFKKRDDIAAKHDIPPLMSMSHKEVKAIDNDEFHSELKNNTRTYSMALIGLLLFLLISIIFKLV